MLTKAAETFAAAGGKTVFGKACERVCGKFPRKLCGDGNSVKMNFRIAKSFRYDRRPGRDFLAVSRCYPMSTIFALKTWQE